MMIQSKCCQSEIMQNIIVSLMKKTRMTKPGIENQDEKPWQMRLEWKNEQIEVD